MAKLALIGTITAVDGKKGPLIEALQAHMARCLRDEPDTLRMEILAVRDDDTKVIVYEVYRDDADFEAHRNGPSLAQWRKEADGTIAKFEVIRCTPVEREGAASGG